MILKYNSRTQVQSTTSLLNRTVILVFNLDVFFQYPTQEWTVSTWKRLERLRRCKYIVNHQWVSYNSKLTTICTISPIVRGIFVSDLID